MVVTDLHGDWDLYRRYRDHFLKQKARDELHTLVIAGDYIHSDGPPETDRSLDIVLDLMALQTALGSTVVTLLGNHELPHIYHIPLSRGERVYTPRFETALGSHRQQIYAFFDALPIWVPTRAGITICHAGAFSEVHNPANADLLFSFSHQKVLDYAGKLLVPEARPMLRQRIAEDMHMPYSDIVNAYLAVDSDTSPRYDDYLLGAAASQVKEFELLWSALFSSNELQYGSRIYSRHVKALLAALSEVFYPQHVLVTGHIGCPGGFKLLAHNHQLRLASGPHAYPAEAAKFLVFDAAQPVKDARDLLSGVHPIPK
ncbi:MAG: metallophosphoesterase family protein [Anaerolineae bacterium]|nr:metallophosphoesterase family protein [Anaerolineae bacterium]